MLRFGPALLLLGILSACTAPHTPARSSISLSYRCSDVAVVGRVTTLGSEEIKSNDFLGKARWNLRIDVKHVVHGSERRTIIPASATSHAQMRSDLDFLIVLNSLPDGNYAVRSAAIWDETAKPKLAEPCSLTNKE